MRRIGDYSDEMYAPGQIDDATAEALLTRRTVADDLAPLVRVLEAYRDAGRAPVPPRGELAARMATGAFVSTAGRHRSTVKRVNGRGVRTATLPKWRRTRMSVVGVLGTVAAKVAGLGMAAKASAGLAIATASVATVGFVGALPEPAQDRFDDLVEVVTGNDAGEPADEPGRRDENAEFGERVSEDAKDGGVDGAEVSEDAKQQGEQRRPDGAGPPEEPGKPSPLPGGSTGNNPGEKPGNNPSGDDPAGDNPGQVPDVVPPRP